jgi:TRAP-type C4-dicarboxylate transport system permease small subunit
MKTINSIVDIVLFYLVATILALLVGICFVQVVARYVFSASFSWAEEVSILLLVWATWGGACLAVKQGTHLRVSFILDRLEQRANLALRLVFNCMAVIFLALVALTSKQILNAITNMTFNSMPEVPMSIMYISAPTGSILMIYYLLRLIVPDFKDLQMCPRKKR